MRTTLILCGFFLFILSSFSFATIINIPADLPTIQAGIDVAVNGDIVLVALGTYTENINFNGKAITVVSEAGRDVTTIQPANSSTPIVKFENGEDTNSVLDGFTITGAYNVPDGGGVYCNYSSAKIINNIFQNNNADDGTGIAFINSTGIVRGNKFVNNIANRGAGVLVYNNYGGMGVVIEYNEFINCIAPAEGGALFLQNCQGAMIRYNLFENNYSSHGGAIRLASTNDVSIINNTFSNNDSDHGGCIQNANSINSLILNNIFYNTFYGYAIWTDQNFVDGYNCLFQNNLGDYIGQVPDNSNIFSDPLFQNTLPNIYLLSSMSPCIDAGDPELQYNDPDGSRNDIGAFYLHLSYPTPASINFGTDDIYNIVNHTPTIYWTHLDTSSNVQEGYQVEVGIDTDWSIAEMWATGEIISSDTFTVYAGNELLDGEIYYLRIRLFDGINWGSWITKSFRINTIPTIPNLYSPIDSVEIHILLATLRIENSFDAENDLLYYEIELYDDPQLNNLVHSDLVTTNSGDTTSVNISSIIDLGIVYWWRCKAHDGYESSDWSNVGIFFARGTGITRVPSDFATIQAAANYAYTGDTILVAPGIYNENIVFNYPIYLLSESGPEVTIISSAIDNTPILFYDASTIDSFVVDGFTITNANNPEWSVLIRGCTFRAENNWVTENHSNRNFVFEGTGGIIKNNKIWNNSGDNATGINCTMLGTMNYSFITNNEIYQNSGADCSGIKIESSIGINVSDNKIYNNDQSHVSGIRVSASNQITITNNEIFNNSNSNICGVKLHGWCDLISINNNLFYGNISNHVNYGGIINSLNSSNVKIINNTFDGNASPASSVLLWIGYYADIRNNIFSNSLDCVAIGFSDNNVSHDYNCFWNNELGNFYNDIPNTHEINYDPELIDPSGNDYHLSPNSACINLGDPELIYNDPDGTRNDIGALYRHLQMPQANNLSLLDEDFFHVISSIPTFTWSYNDTIGSQTKYNIEVGSDTDWDIAEFWNSGEINSSDSSALYDSTPLEDGEIYLSRIKLHNGTSWGDWSNFIFRMNTQPSQPIPVWPITGSSVHILTINLKTLNSTDQQGNTLVYDFELYSDLDLDTLIYSAYAIEEQNDTTMTGVIEGFVQNKTYYWRCRSFDGYEYSDWSNLESFLTRGAGAVLVPEYAATIQSALTLSYPGDTILVSPGTYNENIVFPWTVHLISTAGPDSTIINSASDNSSIIYFNNVTSDTFTLSGFTIQGARNANYAVLIKGCPVIATSNIVTDNKNGACFVFDGPTGLIKDNEIYNNTGGNGSGLFFAFYNRSLIANNKIYNNAGSYNSGIRIERSYNINITGNIIYNVFGNYGGAIFLDGDNFSISNNTIYNCYGSDYKAAIMILGGNGDIQNNIIAGSVGNYGISVADINYQVDCNNNSFFGNGLGNYFLIEPGENDQYENPQLADPLGGDLSILCSSPCIDAGLYLGEEYYGKNTDIGAIEYYYLIGDATGDLPIPRIDISDPVHIVYFVFAGGLAPCPLNSGDADCSGEIDISDAVYLIAYIFSGGPEPNQACQ